MSTTVKPSEHPALEKMQELWMQGKRATAIAQYLDDNNLPPVSVKALAKYGQRNWSSKIVLTTSDKNADQIQDMIQEIESNGMKVKKVAYVEREAWGWDKSSGVNIQVPRKTTAQSFEIIPDDTLVYERAALPVFNITAAGSVNYLNSRKAKGIGMAISIPDMQVGYHRDHDGNLTATHDEAVLDVQNQIISFLERTEGVDLLVWQGDNADFPEFSSHRSAPGYTQNTQKTIDRLGAVAATAQKLVPKAKKVWLEGNHEIRFTNAFVDRLPDVVGLSRSGSRESVFSLPYLCRFNEYDVEYMPGYPNVEYWANDGLRFEHGKLYSSTKGATAAKHLSKGVSTVYGHTHRQEIVWDRKRDRSDAWNILAGSAGCSCKINGLVPSTNTGISPSGKQEPKTGTESWQQGMMVIYYELDGKRSWPENITIDNGRTVFRGQEFVATCDPEGNAHPDTATLAGEVLQGIQGLTWKDKQKLRSPR